MVQNPEKELRFTRARQARVFFVIGAVCGIAVFVWLMACILPSPYGAPELKRYSYLALILAIIAWASVKIAVRCVKHAYLILTPLGIEIFPFFKPEKNLRVVYWSELSAYEIRESVLTLHTNNEQTAGVILSLKPISPRQFHGLEKAIQARLES